MLEPTQHSASEQFRMLRTGVQFAVSFDVPPALLITSAVASEGKSTTAANLAIAFARAGKRVVLVDADLRKPTIHTFFDLSSAPGLSDLLIGEASLGDVLQPGVFSREEWTDHTLDIGDLRIITAGALGPNPGELIARGSLDQVIDSLRNDADLILVDTPPMLVVGDASIMATAIDGILVAVRLDVARRPLITELSRTLTQVPAPTVGVIVTGAEAEDGARELPEYDYHYTYSDSRDEPIGFGQAHTESRPSA
jgi:capsular exopolysaccharide synthesis family protein